MYYAVKTLLDPDLLPNSGMFECIDIRAEPGTLVNPRFPAAVGARSITCNKIARALFGAFAATAARGPRHGLVARQRPGDHLLRPAPHR